MGYNPAPPVLNCPCGAKPELDSIDDDTHDYRGRIWQAGCTCGRSWTVEVADDPDYPES
jgi:hypothetical protein